jgi:hypothetical protein
MAGENKAAKKGPRKLLVATIGLATVSYVAATSCGGQATTSSSTDAGDTGDSMGTSSTGGGSSSSAGGSSSSAASSSSGIIGSSSGATSSGSSGVQDGAPTDAPDDFVHVIVGNLAPPPHDP